MILLKKLEIAEILVDGQIPRGYRKPSNIKKRHPELYDEIMQVSDFLPETSKMGERIYCIKNNVTSRVLCANCDNPVRYQDGRYKTFCSLKCSNNSDLVKKKKEQTYLEKYGVNHISQVEEIKQKIKNTNLKKYGVEHPYQSPEIMDKLKKTFNEKFGCDNPGQNAEIKEKIKNTNLKKYGTTTYANSLISEESKKCLNDEKWMRKIHHEEKCSMVEIGNRLGVSPTTIRNYLKLYGIDIIDVFSSEQQKEIENFLRDLGINIIINDRMIIYPNELDIYLPDYKIAVEYNGLYWHSESHKDKHYHLQKTKMCESKGIRLIHIFEDEWREQKEKCKDTIRHLIKKSEKGVYARNCNVREITWKVAKDFLNQYHLLNAGSVGNFRIGAFDKDENLIGVMVFGHQSNEKVNSSVVELKRFVTNKKNNPGLASKMFKFAVDKMKYKKVIAFVDRRWFTGLVKSHIGFTVIGETEPSLWWTDYIHRYHRRHFKKSDFDNSNDNSNDKSKRALLLEKGYVRIWDCGKLKLEWKV